MVWILLTWMDSKKLVSEYGWSWRLSHSSYLSFSIMSSLRLRLYLFQQLAK